MAQRTLAEIAREIESDYRERGKPVHFSAKPYVDAMKHMGTMDDTFGYDDAEDIVIRVLGNLSSWRGETAQRVKRELRVMLHEKNPRHKMPK